MNHRPYVSIIMATHNRRDVALHTIAELAKCGLDHRDYEVIVVDNASRDGTPEALQMQRSVRLRRLDRNYGSCAKAFGVELARAPIVLFLDDDSFPRPHCLDRMLLRFEIDPALGAAGFTVHLPDGSQECCALPHVFVGCGVGFRTAALREVGGLDVSFFMEAEEYDLSFRLLQGGWSVEVFNDLQVEHLKSPVARRSRRITFYDICNNLRLIARYLPPQYARVYREDWIKRYRWMAEQRGHVAAFERGLKFGTRRSRLDRPAYRRRRLSPANLESVFRWSEIEQRMRQLHSRGVRRIALTDVGKNAYAFYRGARVAGLEVLAIADDNLAGDNRTYHDVEIVTTNRALSLDPDVLVISNTSYVHAAQRHNYLKTHTARPIFNWFPPPSQSAIPEWGVQQAHAALAGEPAAV